MDIPIVFYIIIPPVWISQLFFYIITPPVWILTTLQGHWQQAPVGISGPGLPAVHLQTSPLAAPATTPSAGENLQNSLAAALFAGECLQIYLHART